MSNPQKRREIRDNWAEKNKDKVNISNVMWRANNPEKKRMIDAAWSAKNRQKRRKSYARWYAKNPRKIKARSAAYYAANKDKVNARLAKWKKANPQANRIYAQNRRTRKRLNGGKLSAGLTEKLFKLQRGKCACCGKPLGKRYHLDHRMPLALGGANEDWNMQLLRELCNRQKHAKHPVDFMQERGFLL